MRRRKVGRVTSVSFLWEIHTLHTVTVVTIVSGTNVFDFSKKKILLEEGKELSHSVTANYDFHMCYVYRMPCVFPM